MTRVTYDMQKLDEAVSALATGDGPLKERLQDAMISLGTLHMGAGMHNKNRADKLDSIYERLTAGKLSALSDDEAHAIARDIVELQSGNWHDAVWELEDKLREGA